MSNSCVYVKLLVLYLACVTKTEKLWYDYCYYF